MTEPYYYFARSGPKVLFGASVLFALFLTSLYSYLLFHSLAELFSIVIAGAIFVLAWNFRRFYKDSFLIFIGTAFLFFSFIDLVHTLAYKGMGVFQGYDANLPTQLWIAARYLQSISLLAAPLFLRRKVRMEWMVLGFSLVTALYLLSIFVWNIFPAAYVEGSGLTHFKITSEYIIDLVLAASIFVLLRNRKLLDRRVLYLLVASIGITMLSELAFTFYISVYGFSNLVGHYFKIFAMILVYKAIIESEAGTIYADMSQLRETEKALRASEAELRNSESELRNSEALARRNLAELRSIYALSPVGLCFVDADLRFQAINDALAKIDGLTVEEHIGKRICEVLPENITAMVEPLIKQVLASAKPLLNYELSGIKPGGVEEPSCFQVSFHPILSDEGCCAYGVNIVVQDITERKRAEASLQSSERTLKLFIEFAPTAIAMFDREMRYLAVSRRFLADYRIEDQDVLGKSHYTIFPEISERWKEIHQRCQAGAIEKCDEDPFPRKDGTLDWVRWEVRPWYDDQGKIGGIVMFTQVINEEKKAAEALRESEQRFRSVVESNMIGVVFADRDTGEVSDANDEFLRILCRSREELCAGTINWRALTPPEILDQEDRVYTSQPNGLVSKPFEKEYLRPDGSRVPVIIGGAYLDDEHRKVVAFVLDNTERKRVENRLAEAHEALQDYAAKLKRSNHDLEQFAFTASHDLQDPLRKIKLFGSTLRRQLGNAMPEDALESLERMQKSSDRMQMMIDGLLELSRINTHGSNFEATLLKPIAEDVLIDLEPRIQATGGQVIIEELPTAEVDVLQIRLLFQNLIGNGLKFHQPGVPPVIRVYGTVTRTASPFQVNIIVEDNGIGLDSEHYERIFQPFQRLHGKSEYEGTGLGLAICQRIVDRHHGKIVVQSKPGEGSTFIITLPVQQPGG